MGTREIEKELSLRLMCREFPGGVSTGVVYEVE